jgi:hypothetical protein
MLAISSLCGTVALRRLARVIIFFLFCYGASVMSAEPMLYIHHPPESPADQRYVYHWKILETALQRTEPKFGPFEIRASEVMPEKRQVFELKNAGKLTVMYLGTTPEMERELIPIRIPVDKNLGGYCVFLIDRRQRNRFESVQSLDDLRALKFGLGLGWIDVDILRSSQFNVVTGSSYDGLFEMLVNWRFDVFLRSAVEVLDEYEAKRAALPDLAIEDRFVFYYPMPMYFWFAKNDNGKRLAERAEEGMRAMIEDGTYDQIFATYQDHKIRQLNLAKRQIFRIPNPFLGPETPFADKRLWFDPESYSPSANR